MGALNMYLVWEKKQMRTKTFIEKKRAEQLAAQQSLENGIGAIGLIFFALLVLFSGMFNEVII